MSPRFTFNVKLLIIQTFSHSHNFGIKENTCRAPKKSPVWWMKLLKRYHYYTGFMNPSLDRSLSVRVITCNTVWQIPKSRCPSILSAFAAPGEVCSHEVEGRVSQIPHSNTATITSADWFWRPKRGSFNDIVHLSHWLKVGGWEGRLWEEGWVRVIGGDTGWGALLRRGVRALGGEGLTGGKKKKTLGLASSPSMGPCVSKVMKSKLQHRIAKNKPLLFGRREH